MFRSLLSAKIVRFGLAPVLSFWLAGFGCMIGCEGMVTSAATDRGGNAVHHQEHSTPVVSEHACSSGQFRDCCARTADKAKPVARATSVADALLIKSGASSSGMMRDCPLGVNRTAILTKARGDEASDSPALALAALTVQNSLEQKARLSTPHRLPNRGHTYLHCCVFLI